MNKVKFRLAAFYGFFMCIALAVLAVPFFSVFPASVMTVQFIGGLGLLVICLAGLYLDLKYYVRN